MQNKTIVFKQDFPKVISGWIALFVGYVYGNPTIIFQIEIGPDMQRVVGSETYKMSRRNAFVTE